MHSKNTARILSANLEEVPPMHSGDTALENPFPKSEPRFQFEETKDTPLSIVSGAAHNKYLQLNYAVEDYYEHFPCFAGAKTLARFISLTECYKKTLGIAGHMAEVGVYRGGASFYLAKLMLLYEANSTTQVHGFDWFREPSEGEVLKSGEYNYYEPFERIKDLINVQGLQRYLLLHRLNVISELEGFFVKHAHLQFKLVMIDVGDYDTVARSIREFWPRLTTGGIMLFGQFNHEVAPDETRAVKELLPPEAVIRTFPNGWMPTAYVVKGETMSSREKMTKKIKRLFWPVG